MSEFITRFLNIRSVVKNVYMQIHELYVFNSERDDSLRPSHFEYMEWYDEERHGIEKLKDETSRVLTHITKIYVDLLKILKCDDIPMMIIKLKRPDDPEKSILDELRPKVSLIGLDDAMASDHRLSHIVERIYRTIYLGHTEYEGDFVPHSFYIQGTPEMWKVLRANRLATKEQSVDGFGSKMWSEVENNKFDY